MQPLQIANGQDKTGGYLNNKEEGQSDSYLPMPFPQVCLFHITYAPIRMLIPPEAQLEE
jgi:hypothetical protein